MMATARKRAITTILRLVTLAERDVAHRDLPAFRSEVRVAFAVLGVAAHELPREYWAGGE